ncbi:MAG TPA: Bax inhibitor-1/YccA family protein [Puia sp.]|nr:Bax inhibitor-1/YccA family protein [Puia sp.]
MELFKSGNPALNEKVFQNAGVVSDGQVMTERGTLNKFFFMSLMIMASASFTWSAFSHGKAIGGWIIAGAIIGFILAMVIIFKKEWAGYVSPAYALAEGVFLGGISAVVNAAYVKNFPGIIPQAVLLTFGVVIAMFLLYRFGIIKVTQKFRSVVVSATLGIAIFYLVTWIVGMFGVQMPIVYSASPLSIGLSIFIVLIAALNLILDFDMIEQGVTMGAPKYMEWYAAFGLMVTIIWLYMEILRLLMKIASRR